MPSPTHSGCVDYQRSHLHRRAALKIGAAGIAGLTLPNILRADTARRKKATAKNVIMLFQFGGPPQHDTFDPKPNAPAEIRGEFKPMATKVPGTFICDQLPKLAALADRFALVRSVNHNRSSHNPGAYYSLTGREPLIDIVTANASATDFPHPGAILAHLEPGPKQVPSFVSLPTMIADGPFRTPGEFAGFLGKQYDPLWILGDPNSPTFKVEELTLPDGLDIARVDHRRDMLSKLDQLSKLADQRDVIRGLNAYQQRALDLLTSPATKKAIALHEETPAMRDRYGRTQYGQSTLLARRLIEAGTRFVCVYYSAGIGGWDTHADNFNTLRNTRLPHTNQTVSALIEDLHQRGLLDETIVFWTGDFGRTPKINPAAGRDHWPQCQTVLLAGGGIQGGRIHGASDANGAFPADKPVKPDDITATIFHALGHDPETMLRDQLGRPVPISAGTPMLDLM